VDHGVALAVIDYPLIPRVRMQEVVQACRLALGHLHRQADALGLDRAHIAVAGNSAGGHLVAELMDTAWMAAMDLPPDSLCGGVAISGLFDLAPVALSFQNDSLHLTAEEIERFSPLKRALSLNAPLLVAVGGAETSEFLRQSEAFAQHARAQGARVSHMEVAQANHITVVLDELAQAEQPLSLATRELLLPGVKQLTGPA
jgi:arylformamidase